MTFTLSPFALFIPRELSIFSTLSWSILWSQCVSTGFSNGVSNCLPLLRRSTRSWRGPATQPGTSMKATTCFFKFSSKRKRFIDSMNTSIPLLRNSYRPLVDTINASSCISSPVNALATSSRRLRAALRFFVKVAPFGTKSFSKPFGRTKSTGLSSNSLHSVAVISLTVVKQST